MQDYYYFLHLIFFLSFFHASVLGEQDITESLKSNSFTQILGLPADLKTVLQLVF